MTRSVSYLVTFIGVDPDIDERQLERHVVNYLRPLGHHLTVDLDDDRTSTPLVDWEATR